MAWRSSGTTNDEMVNNLKRFNVVQSATLEQGFRNVDRQFFVPKGREDVAHTDQPLKEGNVHISAPHIYGSALEALELVPNSSMSFLNVGSGTGYVSCIVADILGKRSSHYGIEIHEDVVEHSKAAIEAWKQSTRSDIPHIEIIHGNGLHVDPSRGESLVGFDRIYVGAAVERRNLNKLTRLLRPGGILVGPVDDELVKVVRIGSNRDAEDFTQQVLSGVRFAPLLWFPRMETWIPSTVWDPSIHQYYPDSFRASCKSILLCSNAKVNQARRNNQVNLAAMLPKVLWMDILSYTHRSWFEPEQTEVAFLRQRLLEEQRDAQRAHQARLEAETRCHAAERERDVYRLLAHRWQTRLQDLLRHRSNGTAQETGDNNDNQDVHEDMETALDAILIERRGRAAIVIGNMLRRFQSDDDDDDEDDDNHEAHGSDMEEDEDEMLADARERDDDEENEVASDGESLRQSFDSTTMDEDGDAAMAVSPTTSKAIVSRPQVRTVSISSDDL